LRIEQVKEANMNANRLINMVLRMVMRKVVSAGLKRAGGGKGASAATKGVNKASRMARRAGRF
jgi:hypothetical protein